MTSRGERRREQRISASEMGHIHVLNPFQEGTLVVRMLDRSTDGLSIRMGRSVAPGTLVQVRLKETVVLGAVRYCVRAEGAFRIGILIESSMPLKPRPR
jgi:hypothetical protein